MLSLPRIFTFKGSAECSGVFIILVAEYVSNFLIKKHKSS